MKKVLFVIFIIALTIDTVIDGIYEWFKASYGVTFREIVYTIASPLQGANSGFFLGTLKYVGLRLPFFAVILALGIFLFFSMEKYMCMEFVHSSKGGRKVAVNGIRVLRTILFLVITLYSVVILSRIWTKLEISKFISDYNARTEIYEEYYVWPDAGKITSDKPKNLLYIYMESMETTYASEEDGGEQPEINYIPNLTRIANENISFSDEDKLGGFISAKNTDWTMSAIWATQTGAAFAFPIEGNSDFGDQEHFSKDTVTLGDILEEKGYTQEFLCGSDSKFGGRKAYFKEHGNFRVYDLYTAEEEGYLTPAEEVNWGIEDHLLYRIAKDELTRLASLDQPFNMTMLTVDTHHYDGWICPLCEDTYPDQLANVLICADKQVNDFLDWCKQQDWYDDTVIIIQGDHPRMDQSLVSYAKDRMVYNCFINTGYDPSTLRMKNRRFNTMDMYPTILAAMGYDVPGNRLGLGTNMFSGDDTLCEKLGSEYIDDEVQKYSQYYADHFY